MAGLEAGFVRERRKDFESGLVVERGSVVSSGVVVVVEAWAEASDSWCLGKWGSVKCVGGGWWWLVPRREMMQDVEWQSVERDIGAVEANWRKNKRESGDVGFMVKFGVTEEMVVEGREWLSISCCRETKLLL